LNEPNDNSVLRLDDVSIDAVLRIVTPVVSLQVNVKFTLLPAMKAQRRIRFTALLFLQPRRWMGGGWSTSRPGHFTVGTGSVI